MKCMLRGKKKGNERVGVMMGCGHVVRLWWSWRGSWKSRAVVVVVVVVVVVENGRGGVGMVVVVVVD